MSLCRYAAYGETDAALIAAALHQQAVEYFGQSCTADGPGFKISGIRTSNLQCLGHSRTLPSGLSASTHAGRPSGTRWIRGRDVPLRRDLAVTFRPGRSWTAAGRWIGYCWAGVIHPKGTAKVRGPGTPGRRSTSREAANHPTCRLQRQGAFGTGGLRRGVDLYRLSSHPRTCAGAGPLFLRTSVTSEA